jgi:hypothetical protein
MAAPPVVAAPPVPVAEAIVSAPAAVAVTEAAPEPAAAESFSFSFGGTTVGAQTPVKKGNKRKSPTMSAILSFVLVALVLAGALYLLSR